MVERVIRALIYLAVLVGLFYLIIWVLGMLGIIIPVMIEKVVMVILILVACLVLWRLFGSVIGGFSLFPKNDPPKE